jgi:hypothetical protein
MDLVNGVVVMDREEFDRNRSPGEVTGQIGPNSPVQEKENSNEQDETLNSLMQSARDLAQALSAYAGPVKGQEVASVRPRVRSQNNSSEGRCRECTVDGPCTREVCSMIPETVMNEPPQSPDIESDRECWSESSETYQPIVSPISPAGPPFSVTPGAGSSKESDYELGPSHAQKYWSAKIQKNGQKGPNKRVAMVRPRARWIRPVAIQELMDPRRFRVTTQNPILRTRAIIARTINVDGSVHERAIHDLFVMSRSTATQTMTYRDNVRCEECARRRADLENNNGVGCELTVRRVAAEAVRPPMQDMQTGMEDDEFDTDSDRDNDEERVASEAEDMNRDSNLEEDSGESSIDGSENEDGSHMDSGEWCDSSSEESGHEERSEVNDSSSEESECSEDSSAGTPVQDEN